MDKYLLKFGLGMYKYMQIVLNHCVFSRALNVRGVGAVKSATISATVRLGRDWPSRGSVFWPWSPKRTTLTCTPMLFSIWESPAATKCSCPRSTGAWKAKRPTLRSSLLLMTVSSFPPFIIYSSSGERYEWMHVHIFHDKYWCTLPVINHSSIEIFRKNLTRPQPQL